MITQRAKHDLGHCALLFATPVTEEDFHRVMCGGPLVDYAAATLRGGSAHSAWTERYKSIVDAAKDLIGTALTLGAKVYTQTGLSEVSGKPIPVERLEAVPYATTLVDEQPPEPA